MQKCGKRKRLLAGDLRFSHFYRAKAREREPGGQELARRTAYMRKPVSESLEGRELARRTAYMRKPVSESVKGPAAGIA